MPHRTCTKRRSRHHRHIHMHRDRRNMHICTRPTNTKQMHNYTNAQKKMKIEKAQPKHSFICVRMLLPPYRKPATGMKCNRTHTSWDRCWQEYNRRKLGKDLSEGPGAPHHTLMLMDRSNIHLCMCSPDAKQTQTNTSIYPTRQREHQKKTYSQPAT